MILLFLADGFEETEALVPVDLLRRTKREIKMVGVGKKQVTGSHGISVMTDITTEELAPYSDSTEMVILPGGMPGTLNLEASKEVKKAVLNAIQKGSFIAAICAAPSILGHWGLLKNHTAVCYPGYEKDLGCKVGSESVVCSGQFITAKGAGVALDFSLQLIEALCGSKKALDVKKSIQCR
ncbi:DJ-1 family protein [Ruminococcaceae bacterium BL-4]|nr:DJ-1 family protein [Ruminococcaceae bacterium BL-4]